jgi:lipoxygenase
VPLQQIRRQEQVRRVVKGPPVAVISEDIIKANNNTSLPVKAVKFKVRALVTVRNKHKEDLKETIVKRLDALTDNIIGRNVVLELISTEVDPSK